MARDLTLSIDVGTGSVRAALVDRHGQRSCHIASREHDQIVPRLRLGRAAPGGLVGGRRRNRSAASLAEVPDANERIAAVCACGQMHGTVLVDGDGRLTRETVPLWNDKRTDRPRRAISSAPIAPASYLAESGNPPTPAWPGFKLAWLRDHDPDAYDAADAVIMPKDYINLRLTGEIAMDEGDASCSFLMNPAHAGLVAAMVERLGLDRRKLPPIRNPLEILGSVTAGRGGARPASPRARRCWWAAADYPVALLGSGASAGPASPPTSPAHPAS